MDMSTTCPDPIDAEIARRRQQIAEFSIDHAADAIWWITPDARIRYVNDEAARMLGYSREELMSMSVPDIAAPPSAETFEDRWQELIANGTHAFESVHRRKDGSEIPVWIKGSYLKVAGIELSFCCSRDVSAKKVAEQALRRANEELEQRVAARTAELVASEARYQDLYDNAPDMFASIDAATGRIVQCNRTLAKSTGYAMEELVGRRVIELCYPDCVAEAKEAWQKFLATGEVRDRELVLCCKDGRKIDVSVNVSAIRDAAGQILRSRSTFRDITDFKRAEQQAERHRNELAHVARLATSGEMAAGLAHELNQPLYALSNFAQGAIRRLEEGSLDRDSLLDVMHDIADQAQRAAEVIRSLRRYVGNRERQRAEVDVNESVRRVVDLLGSEARRHMTTIELELAERLPPVRCDAIQIEQVLLNLILNAMEVMVDTPHHQRRVCVGSGLADGQTVQLSVSDRGPGISAAHLERVFDAFYTTKPEGLGLGLAISRTIVKAHGGHLEAAANGGRGATFRFTLPAVAARDK
jgi:two-component system sensor kinase FixL